MNMQRIIPSLGLSVLALSSTVILTACAPSSSSQDADPVVVDYPIAYVKRSLPANDNGDPVAMNVRDPSAFNPGAELFVRDRAAPSSEAISITAGLFAPDETYDVKDLEPSYDGSRMVFAMRAPEIPNVEDDMQPTWNIWEYNFDDNTLTQVITSTFIAEAGQDTAPHYLPDGRIVFTSTRQRTGKAKLLDDDKPQYSALNESGDDPAAVLHVIDPETQIIDQISYNQSSDFDPAVLDSGKIVFSRWDNMGNRNGISLYSINPDGTELSFLYGFHSRDTGTNGATIEFVENRIMPDGKVMVILQPGSSLHMGGDMVVIDAENFTEHDQTTNDNAGDTNPGQTSLSFGLVASDNSLSPAGRYADAFPLHDGTDRLLVSWSQCRAVISGATDGTVYNCSDDILANPNAVNADPLYGIWLYDINEQTQLPVVVPEEGFIYSDAIALIDRTLPPVILDKVPGIDIDAQLVSEDVGVLNIRSVYDFDGVDTANPNIATVADPVMTPVDQRPARFLRIVKAVPMPDDDVWDFANTAFGRSNQQLMREILGYVPIEPDGSVQVKVPANVPFAISVLDSAGRRIGGRHQNWMQLRPGEQLNCTGCHTAQSQLPHGRPDAQASSVYLGASGNGIPFANSVATLSPDAGESMAETYARINGTRSLSTDVTYDDEWTDSNATTPAASFAYSYNDVVVAPQMNNCSPWIANCRIVINYPEHIQPLWTAPRVDPADGITDVTCTSCHAPADGMGTAQVPAGQIDLRTAPSIDEPDHLVSYRELFFSGPEQDFQELDMAGNLVYRLEPVLDANGNQVFQTDADGDLILDQNGDPIPVPPQRVSVPAPMNVNSAMANSDFINLFTTGSHTGWLNAGELRFIYEWLDIGGQYYNDPFDAPVN